jgi:starch phosphorylase
LEERVIFLENYDINVARHLAWGADVWLNTPIREMEASGTSGMKAAINGVLNMSVLDGWWPEVYNSENGWAITAGEYYKHSELKETAEASQIYDLLEDEVTDLYYRSNEAGIPDKWVAMMKHSISSSCCFVSMNRVLMEYQSKYYKPAIRATTALWDNNRTALQEAAIDQARILKYWDKITVREFHTDADVRDHLVESEDLQVYCTVDLAGAASELFCVELFYQFAGQYAIIPMRLVEQNGNIARYEGRFDIQGYGKQNINARLRPANDVTCDLHPEWILWAR